MMTGIIEGSLTQTFALLAPKGRKGEHQFFKRRTLSKIADSTKTSFRLWSNAAKSGFRKGATRVDHMIGRTIEDFATRVRKIASRRGVEFVLMSSM
jgi:hypothetical protein